MSDENFKIKSNSYRFARWFDKRKLHPQEK